ncbi:MAG: cyclic pyranopterin monophosphate synthase MoaC [Acidobacteriota bacterium]|nr:cyclic pyranopterin monophosphate synthase MoaC [Acidobacteriota bacterium]
MNKKLTHLDAQGSAKMVDIGEKQVVRRTARAEGIVRLSPGTSQLILETGLPKGNPFEVARLAGIQAAKQTSRLIPLCHDLNLDFVDVQIELAENELAIRSQVSCRWATGVEMEALTAVSVAALTLYDMCKAADKEMTITRIRLVEKTKETG